MTHEEARQRMMDDLGRNPDDALAAHFSECEGCRADWDDVQVSFAALGETHRVPAPAAAVESVRRAVLADLGDRPALFGQLPFDGLSVVFGTAAAGASLLLLHLRGFLEGIDPLRLAGGAVAWTGVFILVFWLLLRRWNADPQLRHLALGSLAAAGLFLVGNHLVPLPGVVQWCSSHLGAGLKPFFFGLGALYAAVPLLLFSTATGRRWHPERKRALLAGGIFFFLVAPAIFLQCAFFTAGALLAWLAGAFAGSLAGSAVGYWIGAHARARM